MNANNNVQDMVTMFVAALNENNNFNFQSTTSIHGEMVTMYHNPRWPR
jgi:hypothetical protein